MGQKVVPYAYKNPIWVYAYGPIYTYWENTAIKPAGTAASSSYAPNIQ